MVNGLAVLKPVQNTPQQPISLVLGCFHENCLAAPHKGLERASRDTSLRTTETQTLHFSTEGQ